MALAIGGWCGPARATGQPGTAAPVVTGSINTGGKTINMSVPLKDGNQTRGEVMIRIAPDGSTSIAKASLVESITPVVDKTTLAKLSQLPDKGGVIALSDVQAAGFNLKFDAGLMELVIEASADQRPEGDLTIFRPGELPTGPSAATVMPAPVSGYLNLFGGVDHRWRGSSVDDQTGVRLDVETAFRFYRFVAESEFLYDGAVDLFRCPAEARCSFLHKEGLKRRGSRFVYDMPDQSMRLFLGDTTTASTGFQAQPDVLGLRLDRFERTFSPHANLRPTGRWGFRIDRPSEVEVVINGAVVQRFQLRPGNYNLSDLPLQAGANDVELVIIDETGDRRTQRFRSFSDANLLGAGKVEWSATAGIPSFLRDNERRYVNDAWFASAFARYGISNQMTTELSFQGDDRVLLGGGSIYSALPFGFLTLQGAVSQSSLGVGYSGLLNFDVTNVYGLLGTWTGLRESLRLSVEHRSDLYRTPGEFQATASGILYPQYNYSWRFAGAYTVPLSDKLSATLSGRYTIGNDNAFKVSSLTVSKDRYGLDLTLSAPVSDWLSGSLSVGYGNDSILRDASGFAADKPEFRVGVRFTMRPGEKSRITGRFDSLYRDGAVSASTYEQKGYERWDVSADVHRYGLNESVSGGASVGYTGNRGEVRMMHTAAARTQNTTFEADDQRTSVRAGAGIAFAGTKVAVGAPVRGQAFAIVDQHETIAGKKITVGTAEDPRAVSSALGPALVSNIPAYANTTLPVDVDDLPVGYSLGKGSFDIYAPYKAGYALQVGSAFSVSVYGTLHNATGAPIALLSGVARAVDDPTKEIAIFTNAAGKFGADGLAPGRWTVEMATEEKATRVALEIPKGTAGLFTAGTLKPMSGE